MTKLFTILKECLLPNLNPANYLNWFTTLETLNRQAKILKWNEIRFKKRLLGKMFVKIVFIVLLNLDTFEKSKKSRNKKKISREESWELSLVN